MKTINVNFDNFFSIAKAQKIKANLENKGYSLKETKQTGFNKFCLIYDKREKM